MSTEPRVPKDINTRLTPEEQAHIQKMDEELRKMDPEQFEALKRQYEQEMMQMGGGMDAGPETLPELFIELAGRFISNSVFIAGQAPFGRLSVLMAVQHELVRNGSLSNPYLGLMDCAGSLLQKEGWKSFFRGTWFAIASMVPQKIVEGTVVPVVQYAFESTAVSMGLNNDSSPVLLLGYSIASICAVQLTGGLFLQPLEVITQRYQCDIKSGEKEEYEFTSAKDCASKLIARGGYLSLYSGFGLNAASFISYRIAYYIGYEAITKIAPQGPLNLALGIGLAVGALAITHPFDVVRQRVYAAVGTKKQYGSAKECAQEIVEKEGVAGLFAGFKTRLLFAVGSTIARIPLGM